MEMEADGKSLSRASGKAILAAQIVAIGSEKELAGMDEAEGRLVAVMARLEPLRPIIIGALRGEEARRPGKAALRSHLAGICVGDVERRMRRRRPRRRAPLRVGSVIAAAIDDEPLPAMAHLERQDAGMGRAVET